MLKLAVTKALVVVIKIFSNFRSLCNTWCLGQRNLAARKESVAQKLSGMKIRQEPLCHIVTGESSEN